MRRHRLECVSVSVKSQLENVLVEPWDDIRNRFKDIRQRSMNRFTWHRNILPRYRDGSLSVHVRLTCSPKFSPAKT